MLAGKRYKVGAVAPVAAVVCALAFALATVAPGRALAAGSGSGSIAVSVVAEDVNGSHALKDDAFTLVRIASAEVHKAGSGDSAGVTYQMTADFARYDRAWADLDASQVADAARELEQASRDNGALDSGAVARVGDGATEVGFYGLEPGLYLVVRTTVADANKGLAVDPVLVSVPLLEDGSFTYHVRVTPKFEWTGTDHPGGGNGDNGGGTAETPAGGTAGWLPKTGDYVIGVVCLLVAAGSLSMLVGKRLKKK